MLVALLNDTHFGVRGDSAVFLDHQETFFTETFFPYLKEHNIDTVIHLGDTFDRRKFVNFATLERVNQFFFDPLQEMGIDYHTLIGNHDCYYTNTNRTNSVSLVVKESENRHIYTSNPVTLKLGSCTVLLVPWIAKDNYEKCISAIQKSKASVLMGHFEIQGFEMLKGRLCEHGLSQDMFKKFEAVYSGHFHHPSVIGNIRYLGAQYEMTWADSGEGRGFHVFDTETRTVKLIENPNRTFHKIVYDDTELTIEEVASLDVSMLKGTYIKVIVETRTDPQLYDLFMTKLAESGAADVKSIENGQIDYDDDNEAIDEAKDTESIMYEYVDSIETTIERSKIKAVITDLYKEASSIASNIG